MKFVSAGLIELLWRYAEQVGISSAAMRAAGAPDALQTDDPAALVPAQFLESTLRALLQCSQDPALGLRLAEAFDVRMLGFWGYALLSCLTLRQRMQLQMRYQKLFNHAGQQTLRVVGDTAIIEHIGDLAPDVLPIGGDFIMAASLRWYAQYVGNSRPEVKLCFPYPEQAHHRQLRALVNGPLVFEATGLQMQIPARELDRRSLGDPYLLELAKQQLEAKVAKLGRAWNVDVLGQVRHQLTTVRPGDVSLARIASDLRLSARTLRRQLKAAGASFQELLEATRHERAVSYLTETDHGIKEVAARLGYGDPSNFRRAFRRWTGLTPAAYRDRHRATPDENAEADARVPASSR
jgi:AraC-like DNA-binding protein